MSQRLSSNASFHAGPHRLAVLLVCATFPLIWVGGLVTTYDAGMAVPDWPSTFGWNLFLYPWQSWLAGPWDLMIEHGHRLLGALVGLLSIGFAIAVFVWDTRPWMRRAVVIAVAAVVAQGVLGGSRVLLDERQLAQLHGCLGPLCLALFVALATATSRWWYQQAAAPPLNDLRLGTNCWLVSVLTTGQLILGSQLRHVPTTASFTTFRVSVVFHVVLALALFAYVSSVLWRIVRQHRRNRPLLWPVALLSLLLLLQLPLGAGSWVVKYAWPNWLQRLWEPPVLTIEAEGMLQTMTVTAHVAVGSLILATSVFLALRVTRMNHVVPAGVFRRSIWGGLVA